MHLPTFLSIFGIKNIFGQIVLFFIYIKETLNYIKHTLSLLAK